MVGVLHAHQLVPGVACLGVHLRLGVEVQVLELQHKVDDLRRVSRLDVLVVSVGGSRHHDVAGPQWSFKYRTVPEKTLMTFQTFSIN